MYYEGSFAGQKLWHNKALKGRVIYLFLHIGNDVVVRSRDVIGVFDMDNTTISSKSRAFLSETQKKNEVINICDDLPKSYILTNFEDKNSLYISSVSTQTISKRANSNKDIF